MTVALLAKWGDQPPGTLYTSDNTTEATMVTAKVATTTLTGAVAWVPPGSSPGSQGEPFTVAERNSLRSVVSGAGTYVNTNGALYGLAETTPYVTPTPTAGSSAFTGACELAGWFCSVAAGTITIYDALSAVGTPIVPATALAVGPMPIFGAGTTGKLALTTGCFVVLSGAATVRALVG